MKRILLSSLATIFITSCNTQINDTSNLQPELNNTVSAQAVPQKNNILRSYTGVVDELIISTYDADHLIQPKNDKVKVLRVFSKGPFNGLTRNYDDIKFAFVETAGSEQVAYSIIRFGKNGKLYLGENSIDSLQEEIGTYKKPLVIGNNVDFKLKDGLKFTFEHYYADWKYAARDVIGVNEVYKNPTLKNIVFE